MSKTPIICMTRRETFAAAHRMNNKTLTAEQNKQIFGKCNNCHGHNYVVEATVKGPIDPISGMCMDMAVFKQHLKNVIDTLDHKNIDIDVEYFHNVVSTSENVTVYIWNELEKQMEEKNKLYEVKLYETENNMFVYRGGELLN